MQGLATGNTTLTAGSTRESHKTQQVCLKQIRNCSNRLGTSLQCIPSLRRSSIIPIFGTIAGKYKKYGGIYFIINSLDVKFNVP